MYRTVKELHGNLGNGFQGRAARPWRKLYAVDRGLISSEKKLSPHGCNVPVPPLGPHWR